MNEADSVLWARFIHFWTWKMFRKQLGITQMHKILFYIYGVYMAEHNRRLLFNNDVPQAWPFGPVFPHVNDNFNAGIRYTSADFTQEEQAAILNNMDAVHLIQRCIEQLYCRTAGALTRWSHKEGSPWSDTLRDRGLWEQIDNELTFRYFSSPINRIYGE